MTESRVQSRPESSIEQRRNIPERIPWHVDMDPVDMGALMQELLPQGPEERQLRRDFEGGPRGNGGVRAPCAIADDPMVDWVVSEMAFRSRDSDGRRRGSTHRQAAQLPEVDFGWKCVAVRVCGTTSRTGWNHSCQASA